MPTSSSLGSLVSPGIPQAARAATPPPPPPPPPRAITGAHAIFLSAFNAADAYTTTQVAFPLRAPLMYAFTETALAALKAAMEASGHKFEPGTHEYIWAKAFLQKVAHSLSAPLVGNAMGLAGVATALVRWGLDNLWHVGKCLAASAMGQPLPDFESALPLPVNQDMRAITDDVATVVFNAMVFGKALDVGLNPGEVPESLRPNSIQARSAWEADIRSQSSGAAIGASVLISHLGFLWNGPLHVKEPPRFREILEQAQSKIQWRGAACSKAMMARLVKVLPGEAFYMDALANAMPEASTRYLAKLAECAKHSPLKWIDASDFVFLGALSAGYLTPDRPNANAAASAVFALATFAIFGPAWGDEKFVHEMPRPAIEGAAAKHPEGSALRNRYDRYAADQALLAVSTRMPAGQRLRSAEAVFARDLLVCMMRSAMLTVYFMNIHERVLPVGPTAIGRNATAINEWTDVPVASTADSLLPGIGIGMATGLASVMLSHALSGPASPASQAVLDSLPHRLTPRAEDRETTEYKQQLDTAITDLMIVSLHAAGVIGAPVAVLAAIGGGMVSSVDFHNLGVDASSLPGRRLLRDAFERLSGAFSRLWQPGPARAEAPHVIDPAGELQVAGPLDSEERKDISVRIELAEAREPPPEEIRL